MSYRPELYQPQQTTDPAVEQLIAQLEAYYHGTCSTVPDSLYTLRYPGVSAEVRGAAAGGATPARSQPQADAGRNEVDVEQMLGSYYRSTGSFDPTGR